MNYFNIIILSWVIFCQIITALDFLQNKINWDLLKFVPFNVLIMIYKELNSESIFKIKLISIIGIISYFLILIIILLKFIKYNFMIWKNIIYLAVIFFIASFLLNLKENLSLKLILVKLYEYSYNLLLYLYNSKDILLNLIENKVN